MNYFIFLKDISIDAPPSLKPSKKYCDITGFEVQKTFLYV